MKPWTEARNNKYMKYHSKLTYQLSFCNVSRKVDYHAGGKIRGQKHPRREPTENIFSDLKIIKFTYRNTYSTGKFIYKFYKENVPEIFTSFFQLVRSIF